MPESPWHAPSQSADDDGLASYSDSPYSDSPYTDLPYPDRPHSDRDWGQQATRGYRSGPRSGPPGRQGRPGGLPHWLGARPGRFGVSLVTGSIVLGMLACLFTGSGPGLLLNVCLLAGTVAAVLCVRPRAAYLLIPVPAVAYLIAAMITGLVSARAADTSRTAVLISAAQWVAAGFLAMTVATLLVIAVTAGYWLVRWRGSRPPGHSAVPVRPARPGGPRPGRENRDYRDYPDDRDDLDEDAWSGPAAGRYRGDDGYPAGDDYRAGASWPAWNPPPGR